VAVGINQTMTAQDILEGRLIVKVGYAPSRPAEFIILEFKQMQQKS
jgi:phage tail sheath protein FI